MFKSRTGTFTKTSFGQSLFKSQVGTIVKFCCRVFDRDPNCNIQVSLRCKFFEKISGLIISLIQILDSSSVSDICQLQQGVNSGHMEFQITLGSNSQLQTYSGCPKQTRFNLGLSSTCSKIVKTTSSYHKGVVLKRKLLISIVIQINGMNNHWKITTSE